MEEKEWCRGLIGIGAGLRNQRLGVRLPPAPLEKSMEEVKFTFGTKRVKAEHTKGIAPVTTEVSDDGDDNGLREHAHWTRGPSEENEKYRDPGAKGWLGS